MASTVYSNVRDKTRVTGSLFKGMRFWLSKQVPQRTRFVNDVETNGGKIVNLEDQADILIVDHARKHLPVGSYSYRFIEKTVQNNVLEDPENHRVGQPKGTIRSPGSTVQPAKVLRNKFTAEDDKILKAWVNQNPQKSGGDQGNEIYKQLEKKYPHHTYQSWRDRYLKYLKDRPRPIMVPHNPPPTPPSADDLPNMDVRNAEPFEEEVETDKRSTDNLLFEFTEHDAQELMSAGQSHIKSLKDNTLETWTKWALDKDRNGTHTPRQWQKLWEEHVRPRWLRRQNKQVQMSDAGESNAFGLSESYSPTFPQPYFNNASHSTPKTDQSFKASSSARQSTRAAPKTTDASKLQTTSKAHAKYNSPGTSPKRKREQAGFKDRLTSSSPQYQTAPIKRARFETRKIPFEIPSTPERNSSSRSDGVNDVKSRNANISKSNEGETPRSQQISEHHSGCDTSIDQIQATVSPYDAESKFNVPPPEGSWDENAKVLNNLHNDVPIKSEIDEDTDRKSVELGVDSEIASTGPAQEILPETQVMLREQTPAPDFEIADPDGGWESLILSSPLMPGSPESESGDSNTDAQLQAWIDAQVDLGITANQAEWVLMRTSLDTFLASKAVKHLVKTGKIPQDWRGVWTETDDRDMSSTDARNIERLETKHGKMSLDRRWEFLIELGIAPA